MTNFDVAGGVGMAGCDHPASAFLYEKRKGTRNRWTKPRMSRARDMRCARYRAAAKPVSTEYIYRLSIHSFSVISTRAFTALVLESFLPSPTSLFPSGLVSCGAAGETTMTGDYLRYLGTRDMDLYLM